ncbi:MAG: S8 family serine peptidase [Cyclonatronaceae bacterium]
MKTRQCLCMSMIVITLLLLSWIPDLYAQEKHEMYTPTKELVIKFTESLVESPDPKARVSVQQITEPFADMRSYLLELDSDAMVVRYMPDFEAADTLRINTKGQTVTTFDFSKVFVIQLSNYVPFYEVKEALEEFPGIEWIDPPYEVELMYLPDDYGIELNQWNLDMVHAPKVWDLTRGSNDVRVMVLDNGIEPHDDIINKIVNPGMTFSGTHGLQVAGVVGAETDNNLGLASIGWETMIVDGSLTELNSVSSWINRSFGSNDNYVADIINMSILLYTCHQWNPNDPEECLDGSMAFSQFLQNIINNAVDNEGKILVTSAGNTKPSWYSGTWPTDQWPAAYSGVIAVSAVNSNEQFPTGYNSGTYVSHGAPGILVPTLNLNEGYTTVNGTSFSAPHTAAVISLMKAVNPSITASEAKSVLETSADWVSGMGGSSYTEQYGHGRLNAYEAVKHALPNQLNSPFFAVWPSQDIGGSHIFGDSYLEFGTLIIPQGKAAVFSGTLTGFGGDYAKILVQGNMVVESGAQLLDLSIEVAPTGRLIVREGATIRPGSLGELLVEGYARLGSDVVVRRGDIEVAAGGELVVGAGSELYFTTGKGLTAWGRVALNGYNGKPVVMNIDPALSGTWAGVHLHGAGSELAYVHITGAVNGVSAYNTGNISLNSVQVFGSSFDGFRLVNAAADTWNIRADGNLRHGILYDGAANGGVSTSILKGNEYTGIKLEGGAVVWQAHNSRIYDGLTNGIRADDGSYIAVILPSNLKII